jgi:Glycosyl transferase family 2
MRVVMTLLARDEADIVDAQIAFHLHAGVDFVIATSHRSEDGTVEILERYERDGHLRLIHEDAEDVRQAEWVTRMARLAATDHDADWVLNADADEFWWPRAGSLKHVLAAVPGRFGVVRGAWRHFVPRPDDGAFFAERMVVRLRRPAHPGAKETVFHAHQKVAHRASPDVHVELGNHDAVGAGLLPLRGWLPIEILHFSFRSVEQVEKKGRGGWWVRPAPDLAEHIALLGRASAEGRIAEHLAAATVDDDALARGLADGVLAVDTRLRDALRCIRRDDGVFVLPEPGDSCRIAFPHPTPRDDAALAAETAPLAEIDGVVRAAARVQALEARLQCLEREPLGRLHRLAR